MNQLRRRFPELSRTWLANPYVATYRTRLLKAGAIDLRDNYRLVELSRGYDRVVPLDDSRPVDVTGLFGEE